MKLFPSHMHYVLKKNYVIFVILIFNNLFWRDFFLFFWFIFYWFIFSFVFFFKKRKKSKISLGGVPPGGPSVPSEGAFGPLGGPSAPFGLWFYLKEKCILKFCGGGLPPQGRPSSPQRGPRSPRGAFGPYIGRPSAPSGGPLREPLAPRACPMGMPRSVPTHTHAVTKLTVSIIDCSFVIWRCSGCRLGL
jgi:hypothetical protein